MSNGKVKRGATPDKAQGDFALEVDEKHMIPLQEIHCPKCGRFVGYQAVVWGAVKLPCTNSKCRDVDGGKTWITIDITPEDGV